MIVCRLLTDRTDIIHFLAMNTDDFNVFCGLVLSFIICFGVVGNIFSVVIWTKGERCRTYSSASYLIALAVSDTCNLCFSGIVYVIEYLFQYSVYDINDVFCKLLRPAGFFFTLLSTWLIVCVTIERTVAVRQPLNSVRWRSKRKTVIIISSIVIACVLLDLPWTIGAKILPIEANCTDFPNKIFDINSIKIDAISYIDKLQQNNKSLEDFKTCQFNPSSFIYKYERIWRFWIIDFCLIFSIPFIILTTCNIIALLTVRYHSSDNLQENGGHRQGEHSGSRAMTARVVAISVVHCISVGPFSVSVLVPSFVDAVNNKVEYIVWLYSVFNFIWYVNHGVNFILYSMFGTSFRQDCAALCCRQRKHSERKSATPKHLQNLQESVVTALSVSSLQKV